MSTSTITTSIRCDRELKSQADSLFNSLGMSFSTAVNMFLSQAVRERGLPFAPTLDVPNTTTRLAMAEADGLAKDPSAPSFASVDELFADLDS